MGIQTIFAQVACSDLEAAEAWYTPEWRSKAKAAFGAEPVITYYETYVTVDNLKGETIVRDRD